MGMGGPGAVHLVRWDGDVQGLSAQTRPRPRAHRVCSSAKLLRGGGTSVPVALMRRAWWGRERRVRQRGEGEDGRSLDLMWSLPSVGNDRLCRHRRGISTCQSTAPMQAQVDRAAALPAHMETACNYNAFTCHGRRASAITARAPPIQSLTDPCVLPHTLNHCASHGASPAANGALLRFEGFRGTSPP